MKRLMILGLLLSSIMAFGQYVPKDSVNVAPVGQVVPVGDITGVWKVYLWKDSIVGGETRYKNAPKLASELKAFIRPCADTVWISNDTLFHKNTDCTTFFDVLPAGGGTVTITAGRKISVVQSGSNYTIALPAGQIDSTDLHQMGAATGQVLKWNGTAWVPGADDTNDADASTTNELQTISKSGNDVTLSDGGGTIEVDGDPTDDIKINDAAGGDLSGTYPDPTVDGLQGRPVAATAPTSGQVLKWNGSQWQPDTDATAAGGGDGDQTIKLRRVASSATTDTVVWNIWDVITNAAIDSFAVVKTVDGDPTNDVLKTDNHSGDVTGTYDNLNVEALQGVGVSAATPVSGQYLAYNGTLWVPTTFGGLSGAGTSNQFAWFSGTNTLTSSSLLVKNAGGTSLGIGGATISGHRLFIQGTGNTSSSYALRIRNTSAADNFVVRDDGMVGFGLYNPLYPIHTSKTTSYIQARLTNLDLVYDDPTKTWGMSYATSTAFEQFMGYASGDFTFTDNQEIVMLADTSGLIIADYPGDLPPLAAGFSKLYHDSNTDKFMIQEDQVNKQVLVQGTTATATPTTARTVDFGEYVSHAEDIDMTSVNSTLTLTLVNPNADHPSYYTFYFHSISGTDNIVWPTGVTDESGTAIGTMSITEPRLVSCWYRNKDASNLYVCKW